MAPLDFYYCEPSPYSRSVLLTAKALGVQLNLKSINLLKGEHLRPEYLAINPHHTVPTLVDGDLTIWESRAILTYLVSQYGKEQHASLYPADPKTRARVDACLYFDMGTLVTRWRKLSVPLRTKEVSEPSAKNLQEFQEALGWLNDMLAGKQFVAGTNHVTVADHALVATTSSFDEAGFINQQDHSNIVTWLNRCKHAMSGYQEANGGGAANFGKFFKPLFTV